MSLSKKDENRLKVVEYIGDPDNDFPTRTEIALTVLGYAQKTAFYSSFTTAEMAEMEEEGLTLRKQNSKRERSIVYTALLKEAKKGNVQACKEYLDRTEGKVTEKRELTGKDGAPIETKSTMDAGPGVQRVLSALGKATTERKDDSG